MKMLEILTKPKIIEARTVYDMAIQLRFARTRIKKNGYNEPEPMQFFETLRSSALVLSERDPELQCRFQHYLMKHSSVNGLVDETIVQDT